MAQAIALAKDAEKKDEVPVGAVLVHDGRILSSGFNTREHSGRTLGHAELNALEDFNRAHKSWRLPEDTSLFVTVEPCLMCTGAMLSARLAHLYFGASDTRNAGLSRVLPLIESGVFDHRFTTASGGTRSGECGELMSRYFQSKR